MIPRILALCAPMLKRNTETEFWRNEKDSFSYSLPGKGETQQASALRTVPPFSWEWREFYIPELMVYG